MIGSANCFLYDTSFWCARAVLGRSSSSHKSSKSPALFPDRRGYADISGHVIRDVYTLWILPIAWLDEKTGPAAFSQSHCPYNVDVEHNLLIGCFFLQNLMS